MVATPAEPAAGPAFSGAAGHGALPPGAPWRAARLGFGLLILVTAVLLAYELAAARVPQHRAAFEELIRHETGLEVSFSELTVRWGWYGPEAVFRGVQLGEPGGTVLLAAPRLTVALDLWRMARSGRFEARRITLYDPDIDLGGGSGPATGARAARAGLAHGGTRILSRWQGGQIDIEGGTLRTALPGSTTALALSIRHAQLRRLAGVWSADALVLLPGNLGAGARFKLQMQGDPASPHRFGGVLSFEGRRLEFAGWRALAPDAQLTRYLPQAGSGDLELHATFARGELLEAGGRIRAEALEWRAPAGTAGVLALPQLRGDWQLTRRGAQWHLNVDGLELGGTMPASLALDVAADGSAWARGRAQHAPLAALVALARGYVPQLPLGELALGGEARDLTFDFSAQRAAGARLVAAADLEDVSLATLREDVSLSGLSGRLSARDATLAAELHASAAQLRLTREYPYMLDELELAAHLRAASGGSGWTLDVDELQIHRAGASLAASGALSASAPGAPPLVSAQLALKDLDVGMLTSLLGPRVPARLGATAVPLTGGRLESADFAWHGPLDGRPPWDGPASAFTGTATLRDASLAAEGWPDLSGIDARLEWRGSRVHATLQRGELRAVSGVAPIQGLRGTLAFSGGQLQRSTLTGQWLGGAVNLGVAEHREHGAPVLAITGHGVLETRQAIQAAGGNASDLPLAGSAEWSALLTVAPRTGAQGARWQLHADSSLVGVASRLPEPFDKLAGAALPVHLELQAGEEAGQLRVSLGERLAAVAALARSGDAWRIERGAVRLAGGTPALPVDEQMVLDGRVSKLDLAACVALWRQASADAALPALRARVSAGQLLVGTRSFPEVSVSAEAAHGAGTLQLQSAGFSGAARWPALIDSEHPAVVHLARFNIAQPADTALGAELAAVLAPAAQVSVDDLQWQGRPLGGFTGTLAAHGDVLDAGGLQLSGAAAQTRASVQCRQATCSLEFSLDSADAAATLAAFGLRPELNASHARLEGQLRWSPGASEPLATLGGHLHMQLEEGTTRAAADSDGTPFALLVVPALLAGMSPEAGDVATPELRFARLAAHYELHDGEAATTDLHFDGDAEILVRGRVGLTAGDYDGQAWILRGEERLPAAVRRLGPTPKVAAVWLSLRELFAGGPLDRTHGALRLRGTWEDPIVTTAE